MKKIAPLSFEGLTTYSLHDRASKVGLDDLARPLAPGASIRDFLAALPRQLAGADFPALVELVVAARRKKRPVIVGIGAHVIKVGLSPLLIDLMERGVITGLAMNGACVVHDSELAMVGRTSEDVGAGLGSGAFGAARETGEFVNRAVNGAAAGVGMGEAVGAAIQDAALPYRHLSLLATARRLDIPATVHVAIGTDIVHIHPGASGEAIGRATHLDFRLFCAMIAELEGGAYLNVGSAVLLPEVFLKAVTAVRNLGHPLHCFTTANFDFIRHYRPLTNVVCRPVAGGGRGFHFTGHHEIMLPLLAAALLEGLVSSDNGEKHALV